MVRFTFDKKKFELLDENEQTNKLLRKYLPQLINLDSKKDKAKLKGIFGRILKSIDKEKTPFSVYQYIIEYDKQEFPKHPSDYEPIFVYCREGEEKGKNRIIVFDVSHYKACWRFWDDVEVLKVYGDWHSFIPFEKQYYNDHIEELESEIPEEDIEIKHLSDSIIFDWWDREGKAAFVIREKLIDPTKIFLSENFRDSDHKTFIEMLADLRGWDLMSLAPDADSEVDIERLAEEAFWKEFEMKLKDEYTKDPFEEIQETYSESLETMSFAGPTKELSEEILSFKANIESSPYFKSRRSAEDRINSLKQNVEEFNIFLRTLRKKWPEVPKWIQQLCKD